MKSSAGGRVNQRIRTQAALVRAAADLMREGAPVTIADAAEKALVSRATAYRYFSSQEALVVEATVEVASPSFEDLVGEVSESDDVRARAVATVAAVKRFNVANDSQMRRLLKIALEHVLDDAKDFGPSPPTERCGRRLDWIAEALEPARGSLDDETFGRLQAALTMIAGIEGHIALSDVCQLSSEESLEVLEWATNALVDAAVLDSSA